MPESNPSLCVKNKGNFAEIFLLYLAVLIVSGSWIYSAAEHSLFSDEAPIMYQAYGIKEVGRPAQWAPYRQNFVFEYDKTNASHIHPRGLRFAYLAKDWMDHFGWNVFSARTFSASFAILTWIILVGYLSYRKYIKLNFETVPVYFLLFFAMLYVFQVSQYFRFYTWLGLLFMIILILYNELLECLNAKRRIGICVLTTAMILTYAFLESLNIHRIQYVFVPIMILFPFRSQIATWVKSHKTFTFIVGIAGLFLLAVAFSYALNILGLKRALMASGIADKVKQFLIHAVYNTVLFKKKSGMIFYSLVPRHIYIEQWIFGLVSGNVLLYVLWKRRKQLAAFDQFLLLSFAVGVFVIGLVQYSKLILIHHGYVFGMILALLFIKNWQILPEKGRVPLLMVWFLINMMGSWAYSQRYYPTTHKIYQYIEKTYKPEDVLVFDSGDLADYYGNPRYQYITVQNLIETEDSKKVDPDAYAYGGKIRYRYTKELTKGLVEDLFRNSPKKYKYIIIDWYGQRKFQGDIWLYQFIDAHRSNIQEIKLGTRNSHLLEVINF